MVIFIVVISVSVESSVKNLILILCFGIIREVIVVIIYATVILVIISVSDLRSIVFVAFNFIDVFM